MNDLPGLNPPLTDEQIAENRAWSARAREQDRLLNAANTLAGLSRWDRERLGVPPIATHNQAGQLLPREQRWDPNTGRYYGDESVDG